MLFPTPAGMIFLDPHDLGWRPYVSSWIERMAVSRALTAVQSDGSGDTGPASAAATAEAEVLRSLFEKYVPRLLHLKEHDHDVHELVPSGDFNCVISLCSLLGALLDAPENGLALQLPSAGGLGHRSTAASSSSDDAKQLERWFAFSCVWSLGGALDEGSRRRFSDVMREIEPLFPPTGTVYDYYLSSAGSGGGSDFRLWSERLSSAWRPPRGVPFSRVRVPTVDTLRNGYVLRSLINAGQHVLLTGTSGVGKSGLAATELDALPSDVFTRLSLAFSATTTSGAVQGTIEASLERRSKNKLGPPSGKRLMLFVDDLNMPRKDAAG